MRPLTQRAFVFLWLTTIGVIVSFGAACLYGDDAHGEPDQATAEAHDAESHDHAEGDAGHGEDHDGHAGDPAGHGESHNDHGDAAHGGGHGGVDYNKVPMFFDPKLFVWSLVVFLLFLFLARQFAWAPLIRGLDARESRVNRALHDAETARIEAERLLADHDARMGEVQEEVKSIVAVARQEAEAEKARIIAEADAEAAAMRDKALAEIKAAHQRAMDDLSAQMDQQVAIATDHVLGHAR